MGGDYHGFYHHIAYDNTWSGFDFDHRGSVYQGRAVYPDLGVHFRGEVGRYLYSGGSGTSWGAGFCGL